MTAPDYADLRRRARESIDGRAAFEANHRKSDKPLTPIVLEPHVMLALLDERKALIRERDGLQIDNDDILAERNMVMDMHEVQWERANRLEVERDEARAKVEAVKAVTPAECWVTRLKLAIRCTDYIGGDFENGAKWTVEMCCLPCRLRAALDDEAKP